MAVVSGGDSTGVRSCRNHWALIYPTENNNSSPGSFALAHAHTDTMHCPQVISMAVDWLPP